MPRRSRLSGRPSTTSPVTPEPDGGLRALIRRLPEHVRRTAFTHASWVVRRSGSYERLEFLGDGVLGLAIAGELYERFPDRPEGDLARIRAHVVSRELDLAADLRREGSRRGFADDAEALAGSDAVLAAIVESAIGAVYLEFGFEAVRPAIVDMFAGRVEYALERYVDYKTVLQEELARRAASVTYRLTDTSGPPHRRVFTTAAWVGEVELGQGSGSSKKVSEQAAAREALANLDRLT